MKLVKIISIVLILTTLAAGCSYSPAAAAEWEARKAVTARLKSPGSAKFEVSEIAARAEADRLYIVYLAVDSQNGFGAVLRNHALALVMAGEELEDDSQVLHLELSEESQSIARIKELTREMGEGWVLEEWVEG